MSYCAHCGKKLVRTQRGVIDEAFDRDTGVPIVLVEYACPMRINYPFFSDPHQHDEEKRWLTKGEVDAER